MKEIVKNLVTVRKTGWAVRSNTIFTCRGIAISLLESIEYCDSG